MKTERKEIVMIKTERLHHHPDNPRKNIGDISELVDSIKKNGIMQNLTVIPIVCRDDDVEGQPDASNIALISDFFVLIGNRRMEACLQAGLEEVPCRIVSNLSKKEQIGIMLEENMQRSDLTVLEQAQGFQMMLDLGETPEGIAEKTGFSKSTVYHRLNIAKLDTKTVEEKSNSFQLSISDLAALEQIESIKKRNEVLASASDSTQLLWKANNAAKQETRDKNMAKLVELLEAAGVKECEDYSEHVYDGKYEKVREYDLDKSYSQLKLPKNRDGLMYAHYYGMSMYVIKKALKTEKKLTKAELEQKERDRKKKQIKAAVKLLMNDVKSLVFGVCEGKFKASKDINTLELVWKLFMEDSGYISVGLSALRSVYMIKSWYEMSNDERETVDSKAGNLNIEQQALACLYNAMNNAGDIVDYKGGYNEEHAMLLVRGVEILRVYGFDYSDDEQRKIIEGSSELYVKE